MKPFSKPNEHDHDKHPDESKTRTHRFSKLPDDGDPWAPNNLLTPELKKNISWTPVQVGKDQEKAQSENDSHSKIRGGKKPNSQSGTYTMKTFRKPNEQLFSQ